MDWTEVVTVTRLGRTFRACRYCVAHLDWTIAAFERRFPAARMVITQPPWNTGVPASAGTHDKCCAFDITVVGIDWWDAQRFFREHGWGAFYRWFVARLWPDHIHMLSLGCGAPKGVFVPGQIADYYAHRDGMKGHGPDTSWHPHDIDATIFDPLEDDMFSDNDRQLLRDTLAAAKEAADQAERARKGSFQRDKRLIELARTTNLDVDLLLSKIDQG